MSSDPAAATDRDPTPLQRIRLELAPRVGENAVFDGWTQAAIEAAAIDLGIDPAVAALAFPRDRAGMIAAWIESIDAQMEAAFPPERIARMKVRERIRALIWFRLEAAARAREAVRTGLSILSLPQNLGVATRTAWRSADAMWRLAGDTATDYNHYTKRMTLSAIYGATLLVWIDDETEGWTDTAGFLDRRIDDVMRFEKWKAGVTAPRHRPSLTRFVSRLRYPSA
jgi:ubiquinone biosynthesis protein COQ9